MNKINKYIAGMGVAVMSLATFNSCIEEVEPQSSTVIESQVNQSSSAVNASRTSSFFRLVSFKNE